MNNLERSRHRRPVLSTLILLLSIVTMSAQTTTLHPVASNDCGVDGKQPFLVKGDNYTMPDETGGSMTARTCNFGGSVIYAFDRLDIQADYQLEVVYLADSERRQRIVADGNEVQAPVVLEKGKEQRYRIDLPKKAFAYGQLVLVFGSIERTECYCFGIESLFIQSKETDSFLKGIKSWRWRRRKVIGWIRP